MTGVIQGALIWTDIARSPLRDARYAALVTRQARAVSHRCCTRVSRLNPPSENSFHLHEPPGSGNAIRTTPSWSLKPNAIAHRVKRSAALPPVGLGCGVLAGAHIDANLSFPASTSRWAVSVPCMERPSVPA